VAVVVLGLGVLTQGAYLDAASSRETFRYCARCWKPRVSHSAAACHRGAISRRCASTRRNCKSRTNPTTFICCRHHAQPGRATTALPAIELVMTDLQDQLLLRRVLLPADYLQPDQRALPPRACAQAANCRFGRFRTQQAAANYRVLIFYLNSNAPATPSMRASDRLAVFHSRQERP
jgi:hypothetical protein